MTGGVRTVTLLLLASLASCVTACSGAGEAAMGSSDEELVLAQRCERDFGAPLRAKVSKARAALERSPTRFGAEVRGELDAGRVKVLPFCAMTSDHFEHFRKDVDLSAFGATPDEQRRRLRAGETRGMRSVHTQVYGYQWDDHVYIASNMSQELTLETLGHETRHVLRRAHERNFNDQRVTCVEELEAARAEVLIHKDTLTATEERALLDRVHDLYELDKLASGSCGY